MTALLITALLLPPILAPSDDWTLVVLTPEVGRTAEIEHATRSALAWWEQHAMAVPPLASVIHAPLPDDALENPPVFADRTIVVLDVPGLIFGRNSGIAAPGHVWAVNGPDLVVILTHELGHALYGLPNDTACQSIDIMCSRTAQAAYLTDTIGCRSLAALSRPCTHVYLPSMQTPYDAALSAAQQQPTSPTLTAHWQGRSAVVTWHDAPAASCLYAEYSGLRSLLTCGQAGVLTLPSGGVDYAYVPRGDLPGRPGTRYVLRDEAGQQDVAVAVLAGLDTFLPDVGVP